MTNKYKKDMDIYSPEGTKVVFAFPDSGYDNQKEEARKHLEVGGTYTVDKIIVGNTYTYVYLKEIPGIPFNSVQFANS